MNYAHNFQIFGNCLLFRLSTLMNVRHICNVYINIGKYALDRHAISVNTKCENLERVISTWQYVLVSFISFFLNAIKNNRKPQIAPPLHICRLRPKSSKLLAGATLSI